MALILREDDVMALLQMADTIGVIEKAFAALGEGKATNHTRIRFKENSGIMHLLAASIPSLGIMGHKTYTIFRSGMRYVVMLYSASEGDLLAIIEADWLGGMRTGATSALATAYLARHAAATVGLIGAGRQATLQLLGVCQVRQIEQVFVYSRRLYEREQFCKQMSQRLNIDVRPVNSSREAIEHADIVITATSSPEPVFPGDWLQPGTHINAIGSNWSNRREIDQAALLRSDLVVTDSLEQALSEAGDLLIPARAGHFDLDRVHELASIIVGSAPRRQSEEDITLYKGLGIALEDIATASLVYRLAIDQGRGENINILP
ncbi:MAG TPA: ornithine cyclodeaminase family protein [Ktedonobacteraceae bacterium]|nr:ornithine cyclodeaminase family protein [Ktedonobacteraceae bacterium]